MNRLIKLVLSNVLLTSLLIAQNLFSAESTGTDQSSVVSYPSSLSSAPRLSARNLIEGRVRWQPKKRPAVPQFAATQHNSLEDSKEEKRESKDEIQQKSSDPECCICYDPPTKDKPNVVKVCTPGHLHMVCKNCFIDMAIRSRWEFNAQLKRHYPIMKCNVCMRQYDAEDFRFIEKFVLLEPIYQQKLRGQNIIRAPLENLLIDAPNRLTLSQKFALVVLTDALMSTLSTISINDNNPLVGTVFISFLLKAGFFFIILLD